MQHSPCRNDETQYYYEDEIDLKEIFRTLIDNKKLMLAITVGCVLLAILYIVISTPLYEIKMQLKPGLNGWSKPDIVSWLKEKQYVNLFPDPDEDTLAMLKTLTYKDDRKASMVTLSLYWHDPKDGKAFMSEFTTRWKNYYLEKFPDENIVLAKNSLKRKIDELEQKLKKLNEIDITQLENRITEKLKLIDLKKDNIETIKSEIEKQKALLKYFEETAENVMMNTRALIKSRDKLTSNGQQNDISMLFLLNSIQQNIAYADQVKSRHVSIQTKILQEQNKISVLTNDIEEIQNAIAEMKLKMSVELEGKKASLAKQIKDLQYQFSHIGPIKVMGPATSTLEPVKPKKNLILSLALICGMFLGFVAVFFRSMLQG